MTKEDALKQYEESEKDAQADKKFKQTIKKHATDEEMLAWDDEADTFHSFRSMTVFQHHLLWNVPLCHFTSFTY